MATVLFDLDGTLVDTTYLHTVCWWQALSEAGLRVPMVNIHAAIGMGSDQLLPHLLDRDPDEDEAHRWTDRHDELFRKHWTDLQPTNGAADLVRACAGRGSTVVLATSAGKEDLMALRRAVAADDAIAAATTSDDAATSKPAPDIVQRALELAGVAADQAVFVGDTVWDIQAAHRAGVPCVTVTCGGTTADELRRAGADEVYVDPADVLANLERSLLSRLDR
jgi:HAD superfamily hydrolase (TIGR01509 family)